MSAGLAIAAPNAPQVWLQAHDVGRWTARGGGNVVGAVELVAPDLFTWLPLACLSGAAPTLVEAAGQLAVCLEDLAI